jgi:hypothetical protein
MTCVIRPSFKKKKLNQTHLIGSLFGEFWTSPKYIAIIMKHLINQQIKDGLVYREQLTSFPRNNFATQRADATCQKNLSPLTSLTCPQSALY